jgi:hypothetical protein
MMHRYREAIMTAHQWIPKKGFFCEAAQKYTRYVWTDHAKPGNGNSCEHCTGEARTLGGDLYALNQRAKAEAEAAAKLHEQARIERELRRM